MKYIHIHGLCTAVITLLTTVAALTYPAEAGAQGITSARKLNPTTVELTLQGGKTLTVDFYGPRAVRFFRDDKGGIVRSPEATPPASILVDNPRREVGDVSLSDTAGLYLVRGGDMSLSFDKSTGRLSVSVPWSKAPIMEETAPASLDGGKVKLTLREHDGEQYYGGGVQNGRFSHRGTAIEISNTNSWTDGGVASPAPFFWSTAGYGILFHTFKPGLYDFGASKGGEVLLSHDTDYLDFFLMADSSKTGPLREYYDLTGYPALLPKFGFYEGHLNAYNRDYWTKADNGFMLYEDGKRYNESQKDNGGVKESLNGEKNNYQFSARAAIDRYLKNDMPLGWFLPNDGYGTGYGQTNTLDGNIANLKSFGDYARSKGVEIGLWTQSDLHPKAGVEPLLQRDIVKEVRDAGVRVLKTDVAWVGAGYSFGLNGVSDVGKIMPYYGSDARPFIISLDGWAGTQRYAGIWTGDQTGGEWEYIRFHIPTFIGAGLSGIPFITSDVDGIFGGKNMPVNIREYQWKTFTPMELNMDGWGLNPKYPNVLGEPATSINRSYLKLKSMLLPYTYSIARGASLGGAPMMGPAWAFGLKEDAPDAMSKYEFMYGPSLLVAPIYRSTRMDKDGDDVRNGIVLPEGDWYDYFTDTYYKGGRIINDFDAPIWKLPLFVRGGAVIPMTRPNNNPSGIPSDYRAYDITPGREGGAFREYDDDGRTMDYTRGRYVTTDISQKWAGSTLSITIDSARGGYTGYNPVKATELMVRATAAPSRVEARIGGRKVRLGSVSSLADYENGENVWYYDAQPQLNRFATKGSGLENVSITGGARLMIKLSKSDVTKGKTEVAISRMQFAPEGLERQTAALTAVPAPTVPDSSITAFAVTPVWQPVSGADYYEVRLSGDSVSYKGIYSTISRPTFTFEDLCPKTKYAISVRAVNKQSTSPWSAPLEVRTKSNPLEFAVANLRGFTTCNNQGGQGLDKLFDRDERTVWHTDWNNNKAVPFDLTVDLRGICTLDSMRYLPREDAANGTILRGTVTLSTDRENWTTPVPFTWERNASAKTFAFAGAPEARYIRISVQEAVGGFGSGRELYVFRRPGTKLMLQGDINKDNRIDENDLTSYMNYTGLRRGDADFSYVEIGDINHNGLIDAFDISNVATELDGGVYPSNRRVEGRLVLTPDKKSYAAGEEVRITVSGRGLKNVNALSFALPYDTRALQYKGVEKIAMKDLENLTYDRLHTNGQKALYPTFVNRGNNFLLEDGDHDLFVIRFTARTPWRYNLKAQDGILVDRNLGSVTF